MHKIKVAISEEGQLSLKRNGSLKKQSCPLSAASDDMAFCGDWCPMFKEPEFVIDHWEIELCRCVLVCSEKELMDERADAATPPANLKDVATEVWAAAQLMPEEGIEDGVNRIESILIKEKLKRVSPLVELFFP